MPFDLLAIADIPIEVDFDDWDAVIAQVSRVHAVRPFTTVVTQVDRLVPLAGLLRESLGLRTGITTEAARNCNDKAATHRCLAKAGLPVTRHQVVHSSEEAALAAKDIGLPVIVKPLDATSAAGLMHCTMVEEVTAAVAGILDGGRASALVEEYLIGPEIGVLASRTGGKTKILYVFEAEVGPPPKFVKLGGWFPSVLADEDLTLLSERTEQALAAVGLDDWVALLQFMLVEGGPKVVEINPRLSGGQGVALIAATSGYEPTLVAVEAALGRQPEPDIPQASVGLYSSIVFDEPGRLFYRPEALRAIEGLETLTPPLVEVDVQPGEAVLELNHPRGGTFGRIVLAGDSREAVLRDHQRILDQLDLRVEPAQDAASEVAKPHTSCC
ncbi:ATP-grasp domain-containing protein [Herbidospora mongoliensis]|uniref:ATP-grasp domain-containing protein n=1 Tax=Herbidospora mongoliensis TaxID=688067 RepID=UPI001C3F282F|nr:ATP-grasp domain-containing protein [Herbidospora mongoliensis]